MLLEFTSARFIRLRFQRIRTLNADLMMFAHKDPNEIDPIVTRRVSSGKTVAIHVCSLTICSLTLLNAVPAFICNKKFWETMNICCYLSKSGCLRFLSSQYFVIFSVTEITISSFLLTGVSIIHNMLINISTQLL